MTLPFANGIPTSSRPVNIHTIQDVWDWVVSHAKDPAQPKKDNPHGFRLQYLTKLQSHCSGAPLATIFAGADLLMEFDQDFPKVKKGVHPRGDLPQDIETYKKWRQGARKAIEVATGAAAEKAELRSRQDGWTELLAAIKLHCTDGGVIQNPKRAIPVTKLAEVARRAGIEPWELAIDGTLERLEGVFAVPDDREHLRRAQRFLNDYSFLPELAAVLPEIPASVFPTLRQRTALPVHIEAFLAQLVDRAAMVRDEVSGKDSQSVSDETKKGWLSALRHHLRSLSQCPAEPDLDYNPPATNLETVNNVAGLFHVDHLKATLRQTEAQEHLPDHISHVSAYDYYGAIMVVLSRNDLLDDATYKAIAESKFMKDGRELANGMTDANKTWCKALITDPRATKRFRNMHRVLMAKANKIFDTADAEGRSLTIAEITQVRQLGTCAAASAIEYAGRPIRLNNCLGLRMRGSTRNFQAPKKGRPYYAFALAKDETKSGKDEPETQLRKEMYGPQVIAWYLSRIRPLFAHHAVSIYLFPAVEAKDRPLGRGLFDKWFQRATAAAGLPMTFHRWRHGYASILLAKDWGNLPHAAEMLGNTPAICEKNYVWINKEKLITEGQNKMLESAEAAG